MRKLFFAIAAMAAMLTSCSKDDTFGGLSHGKVTFEVSTPELATRAYGDGMTATNLYYAVYDVTEKEEGVRVDTNYGTTATDDDVTLSGLKATVSIDLVEGRQYEVAFWAESGNSPYVFKFDQKSVCYEGSTDDLVANNEDYDAFFAYVGKDDVKVGQTVNVTLKRPFAQLNVATNDTVRAGNLGVVVEQTGITVEAYTSFNLQTGKVNGGKTSLTFGFNDVTKKIDGKIEAVIDGENRKYDWLTMNYILVNDREPVDVTFNFTDANDKVYTRPYAAVPVERNHRTNIIGSILTSPTDFNVEINPEMQTTEHNVGVTRKVTNVEELIEAIENIEDGGTIVLEENIDNLTNVLEIGVSTNTSLKAQNSLSSNVVTRTETTDVPTISINGNGKTISSSASRAIRITSSNLNVIISNLKIVSNAKVVYPNDVRGVSIDAGLENVSLTLDNCTVDFTDSSANDWAYAVNVSGNGTGHKVTINGGEYEGANVVNVHGANNIVTVNNATLTSTYPANNTYYGACIWVLQNQGSKVFAKGNTFNGSHAIAFNIGNTELTESDNIDNCEYVGNENGAYKIYNPAGLKKTLETAGAAGAGNTELILMSNIDMTNFEWTPIYVNGYNGAGVVTLNGNDKTITGMKDALFSGGFAGGSGIVIKNLTIKNAKIEVKGNEGTGYGAFICAVDSMPSITLENCHLINSSITGNNGSRVGGLIGWTSGYSNKNDGPVKTYVNINNCSVIGCTLTNAGSIGAINGHAGASDWTYTTIENCVVENNNLISTDDGGWRVGVVVGTANVGEVTIKNITESGNTLSQTGKTAPEGDAKRHYYGRFVPVKTGLLIIDDVATVSSAAGLANVVANGYTTINLVDGEYDVDGCAGKTLTLNGSVNAVLKLKNDGEDGCDYAFGGNGTGVGNITFNGLTIDTTGNTGNYKGFAYMKGTFNNCNFVGAYSLNNANDFVFNNCTFDFKNGYFWTWGANSVKFDGCTFNGNSKNILAHGYASTVITINNCNFAATEVGKTGAGDPTACVEIDPAGSNTYTINFTGENIKTEHYAGWTRVKDASTGHTITGVE